MDMESGAHSVPSIVAERIRQAIEPLRGDPVFHSRRIHYEESLYRRVRFDLPVEDDTDRTAAEALLDRLVVALEGAGVTVLGRWAVLAPPDWDGEPVGNARLEVEGIVEVPDPSEEAQTARAAPGARRSSAPEAAFAARRGWRERG